MNIRIIRLLHFVTLCILSILLGCNNNKVGHIVVVNNDFGKLSASKSIYIADSCSLSLDSCSAPKPIYMDIYEMGDSTYMSFLNHYTNSVYVYNLKNNQLVNIIELTPNNSRILKRPIAFTMLDGNSIGVLDASLMQFIRIGIKNGKVISRFDLKDIHNPKWPDFYPQYNVSTSNHLWNISGKIYIPGQFFRSISNDNLEKCKLMSIVNLEEGTVSFRYNYPRNIYGNNANWEGGAQTEMFATLGHDDKFVLSFPPSHEIYVDFPDSLKTYSASSTFVNYISSIDYEDLESTPEGIILNNYLHQFMYGPLIFDKYNCVYYRFLNWPIDESLSSNNASDREISLILFDTQFNYLAEKKIGTGKEWNIRNSFVTEDGLFIEWIDPKDESESLLNFRIFKFK